MQTIEPEQVDQASSFADEVVPALKDTKYYFALTTVNGQDVLCVLDTDGRWRPTTYDEMMKLT